MRNWTFIGESLAISLFLSLKVSESIGFPKEPKGDLKCSLEIVSKCTLPLAKSLGFDSIPYDASKFTAALTSQIMHGERKTIESVCQEFQSMTSCYGDLFSVCTAPGYIETLGEDVMDAITYAGLAGQYKFLCGQGYEVFKSQISCIIRTYEENKITIDSCQSDLINSVGNDPANTCNYVETFQLCESNPYMACGRSASSLVCNAVKGFFELAIPACNSLLNCEMFDSTPASPVE